MSTPLNLTGISIADVDAGASALESVISTTVGTLTVNPGSGATVTGDNSNSVKIVGTLTQINAALNGLDFNPGSTPGNATLTLTTDDQGNTGSGGAKTDTDAIAVTITPPNAIPVVDLNGGATGVDVSTTFKEGGTAADIAGSGTITDGDAGDNIERLTITLTNPQTDDALSIAGGAGSLPTGISLDSSSNANTIILTGSVTPALYTTALQQIQFNNSSENPNTTARTVTVVANDGVANSATATSTIAVTAVNDPPTIAAPTYTGNANLTLTVADGTGDLLDGATDLEGTSVSVVAATLTSAQATTAGISDNVTVNADGSFTFTPVPGYVGDDTFVYELQDNGLPLPEEKTSVTATVTLTDLNGASAGDDILWFIDEDSTGANLGTQADPFQTLAAFNAASTGDGDFVFLDTDSGDTNSDGANSYGGGITLKDGQKLIGDGTTGTTLAAITDIKLGSHNSLGGYTDFDGSGTNPTILNGSGNAIDLGSGNTVRGVDVGNASGVGIRGTAVGALAIEDVAINNATGGGFEVATSGNLNVDLDNLTSGGGTNGVNLTGISGTFSTTAGAITGATGTAFNVNGGSATVTYGGTITNTAGRLIEVKDTTGGSVTFSNATANAYTDSGTGISIDGAAGNVTLSNGDVDSITIQGNATNNASGNYTFNDVRIANAGGISIFGIGGRITGALDFNNVDIINPTGGSVFIAGFNGSTIDFDANSSISSSSSTGVGITLLGNSSGSTTFNGPITLNSGAQDAVSLTGNQNAYTTNFLGGLDITTSMGTGFATSNAGTLNLTGTNNINSTAGTAISISGATIGTSGITFNNVTSTNATGNGITLGSLNGGNFGITGTTTVSGAGVDGINIGVSDATIAFADVRVSGTTGDGIDLLATSGPVTFTTVAIDDTTGAGVLINQNTGAVNINGGTIGETASTAATTGGDAVNITDSRANITIAAAITNTAGRAVEITNSGGTTANVINFTGAITDTGTGIFLNNNGQNSGATLNFTGGLNLNTGTNNAFTATNGGTVTVQGSTNTITSTGTAVNLDGIAIGGSGVTLNNVTSTNATGDGISLANVTGGAFTITGTTTVSGSGGRGVSLTNVGSNFSAVGGSITGVTGTAFNVSGGGAMVTYGGTINNSAGRAIAIADTTGGSVTFTNTSANAYKDSGTGILIDGAAGNVTLSNGDLNGSSGINIAGDNTNEGKGTYTFNNVTVDVSGDAVNINGGAGDSIKATIDFNNVDITNPTGRTVAIAGRSEGTVDFDAASAISTNTGTGILIDSNAGGSVTFNSPLTLNTGTNNAITLTSNTGTGGHTTNFLSGLDLTTSSGTAFSGNTAGTLNVTGTNNINSTGGTAIDIQGATIGSSNFTLNNVTSTNATGDGINLANVTGGTFTITGTTTVSGSGGRGVSLTGVESAFTAAAAGGSITNVTGTAFNISGSMAAVTYGGTINNTAGQSVNIQDSGGTTANTIDFTGAITDSGAGIFLNNNDQNSGATINFTGGLTLNTTTNDAFTATNGGTVTVQGTTNTITTTTGTALNVSATTIGLVGSGPTNGDFGLTFQSISANADSSGTTLSSGIILSAAGSNGFTITGDGDSSNSNNTSGGTIARAMGSGLSSSAGHGIYLRNVDNISLFEVAVTNSAQNNIDGEQVHGFLTLDNVTLSGASGSGSNPEADGTNVEVRNSSDDLTYTVRNSSFANANGEGVEFRGSGSATATFNVTDNNFDSVNTTGINSISTGSINFTATGNVMTNIAGAGIGMDLGGSSNGTFNWSNNNVTLVGTGAGLGLGFTIRGSGTYTGTISDNVITNTAGTNTSGIRSVVEGNGDLNLTVNNNTINTFSFVGILLAARGGDGILNADITNNTATVGAGAAFPFGDDSALAIDAGNGAGQSNQVCANVSGNTLTTTDAAQATVFFRTEAGTTTRLEGLAIGSPTTADAITHLTTNNTLSAGSDVPLVNFNPSNGTLNGSTNCL